MVGLVTVTQPPQDLDRHRDRRFGHLDRLEPPLKGRVLLDVLAVVVERRGADRLQLTAGQHRLEDRGGVDSPLRCAGTDEGVDLVNEQHHVAAGLDLREHLAEPLLEVAAVTGASHESTEVERVDLLVAQRLRHVAAHDLLRQPLDDGGLPDAGFPDEYRVVLRTAREHRHHPLDLLLAADDRVELVLAGSLGEVPAELVQHLARCGRRADIGSTSRRRLLASLEARQQLQHLRTDAVEVGAQLDEHLGRDSLAFSDQPEKDVLGPDVGVVDLQRLAQRQLQHLLGARSERNVPGRGLLALADDLLDLLAHGLQRDA